MRGKGALVACAVLGILFLPALAPGTQFIYRDTGRMHEPVKRFVAAELASGRLPEWNPHSALGAPLVAGSIDAVLHPFNLLLLVLPAGAALKGWILASFLAAALGGRAWGRALGLRDEAATLCGLVFAMSGPLVSSSDNVTYLTTYAALPGYFAALHGFLTRGGPARLALVMLASFVTAAGGDPQGWGIALLASVPYALWARGDGGRRQAVQKGLLAVAAATAAAAPVILPILAWVGETRRAIAPDPTELLSWNLSPRRLPELLLPGLFRTDPAEPESPVFALFCGGGRDALPWYLSIYAGAAAILLAGFGALRRRWARPVLASILPFIWAALGPHAGFGQLALAVPLARSFRYWEKLAIWPALAIALCAAAGLDAFLEERSEAGRRLARAGAIGGGALLALAAIAAVPGLVGGLVGGGELGLRLAGNLAGGALHAGAILGIVGVVALAAARGRIGGGAGWALAAVAIVDLLGANVGAYVVGAAPPGGRPPLASRPPGSGGRIVTAFSMREDRWPERGRLESTWEWGRRTLEPSWNVGAGVANFRDYQGLPERRHREIHLARGADGRWERTGLWGVEGVVVPGRPELAAQAGVPPPFELLATDPELPAWIVAVTHRPRAYLAEEVAAVDETGARAFAMEGGTPGRTVVEGVVPPGHAGGAGEVQFEVDLPGRTELSVRADAPGLLVLNDAFTQGWSAEVDGRAAPIVRANFLARGVWVERGPQTVRFTYRTPGLRSGLLVALAGAAIVAGWSLLRRRRAAHLGSAT